MSVECSVFSEILGEINSNLYRTCFTIYTVAGFQFRIFLVKGVDRVLILV